MELIQGIIHRSCVDPLIKRGVTLYTNLSSPQKKQDKEFQHFRNLTSSTKHEEKSVLNVIKTGTPLQKLAPSWQIPPIQTPSASAPIPTASPAAATAQPMASPAAATAQSTASPGRVWWNPFRPNLQTYP